MCLSAGENWYYGGQPGGRNCEQPARNYTRQVYKYCGKGGMKKMRIKFRSLSLLLICLMAVAMAQAAASEHPLLEEAKGEGKVQYYANITGIEPVMDAFQAQYGLPAEYTRISTSVYVPTVMTEFQAGPPGCRCSPGPIADIADS